MIVTEVSSVCLCFPIHWLVTHLCSLSSTTNPLRDPHATLVLVSKLPAVRKNGPECHPRCLWTDVASYMMLKAPSSASFLQVALGISALLFKLKGMGDGL